MKAAGNLKPTATTYGCLLMVCARQGNVDRAFLLYEEAYDTGVLATDECHNILIGICSDAGRSDFCPEHTRHRSDALFVLQMSQMSCSMSQIL